MTLIECPACGRQISVEAVSCPGCGHPHDASHVQRSNAVCYACKNTATTRCQRCGKLACVQHVYPVEVIQNSISRGISWGISWELRCDACKKEADELNDIHRSMNIVGIVIGVAVVAFVLLLVVGASKTRRVPAQTISSPPIKNPEIPYLLNENKPFPRPRNAPKDLDEQKNQGAR